MDTPSGHYHTTRCYLDSNGNSTAIPQCDEFKRQFENNKIKLESKTGDVIYVINIDANLGLYFKVNQGFNSAPDVIIFGGSYFVKSRANHFKYTQATYIEAK